MGAAELGHRRAGGHHALCAAIPSLLLGGGVPSLGLCWSLLGGRGSYTAELCGGWPSQGTLGALSRRRAPPAGAVGTMAEQCSVLQWGHGIDVPAAQTPL